MTELEKAARLALERIAAWNEHPSTLGVDYGSNGVRDYYRQIARDALTKALATAEPVPASQQATLSDDELPGMWSTSDLIGGETDTPQATPERKLVATPDHNGAPVPASPADMQVYNQIAAGYWTERKGEPVAWVLTRQLERRETTTRGYLWFSDPKNACWTPLYTSPQVPEGFALVPVEPTPEMLKAMENQWLIGSQVDMAKREYAAMLDAAREGEKQA